jgi:hypothetical protein
LFFLSKTETTSGFVSKERGSILPQYQADLNNRSATKQFGATKSTSMQKDVPLDVYAAAARTPGTPTLAGSKAIPPATANAPSTQFHRNGPFRKTTHVPSSRPGGRQTGSESPTGLHHAPGQSAVNQAAAAAERSSFLSKLSSKFSKQRASIHSTGSPNLPSVAQSPVGETGALSARAGDMVRGEREGDGEFEGDPRERHHSGLQAYGFNDQSPDQLSSKPRSLRFVSAFFPESFYFF